MSVKNTNIWDNFLIFLIATLSLGTLGGALQIIRVVSMIMILPNIYFLFKNKHPRLFLWLIFIALLWLFVGLVLLEKSITPTESKIELFYILLHLNLVLTVLIAGSFARNAYKSLLTGWIIFCGLSLIIGFFEINIGVHMPTNSTQTLMVESGIKINGVENKRYAAAFFNNYNEFMTALSFAYPYLFGSLLYFVSLKKQLTIWGIIFVNFIVVVVSASRGAIACLGLSMIITLIYSRKIKFPYKRTLYGSIIICGLIGVVLFTSVLFSDLLGRMDQGDAMEDLGRLAIYELTWNYFSDSNYWGVGAYGIQSRIGFASHNLWLEILCQYGWFVFIPVIYLIFIQLKIAIRMSTGKISERCCCLIMIFTIPFASVINSGYLNYPFVWVSAGSLLLIVQHLKKLNLYTNDSQKNPLLLVRARSNARTC